MERSSYVDSLQLSVDTQSAIAFWTSTASTFKMRSHFGCRHSSVGSRHTRVVP